MGRSRERVGKGASAGVVGVGVALVLGVAGCGLDGEGDRSDGVATGGAAVTSSVATGEGVAAADIVEAGSLRAADLSDVTDDEYEAAPIVDAPPEVACGTYATLAPDGPEADVVEASVAFSRQGRDAGVRYTVVARGEVVVLADEEAARTALSSLEAGGWVECLRDAYVVEERLVDDGEVDVDEDDGRAVASVDVGFPDADDTEHVNTVRVAVAGRALLLVSSRASGQVLDDFDDGEPIDDVADELAARVAALG